MISSLALYLRQKLSIQIYLLRRILIDQIWTVQGKRIVRGLWFWELIDEAVIQSTKRSLSTADIIAELVALGSAPHLHEELGLRESEIAFYDVAMQNDSPAIELGHVAFIGVAMSGSR